VRSKFRCSRLERFCGPLRSPRAILRAAALASSDFAGGCARLERFCGPLRSPRAILRTAALASSDFAGRCSRLLRRYMELAAFASCEKSCSCSCLLRNYGEPSSLLAQFWGDAFVSCDILGRRFRTLRHSGEISPPAKFWWSGFHPVKFRRSGF
jgi:hypothetical protein